MLVTAVLVVSLGRVGDIYGRVKMYNLGFAVCTLFSVLLSVTWLTGVPGALWIIVMRFAIGLISVLVGIVYSLLPYGGHPTGWSNPYVLTAIFGGIAVLALFAWVETKVPEPMFRLDLFRIRAFTTGNIAGLLAALGRGGLQFMLII